MHVWSEPTKPRHLNHGLLLTCGAVCVCVGVLKDNTKNCQSASCGPCGVNCSANSGCPYVQKRKESSKTNPKCGSIS